MRLDKPFHVGCAEIRPDASISTVGVGSAASITGGNDHRDYPSRRRLISFRRIRDEARQTFPCKLCGHPVPRMEYDRLGGFCSERHR
jgi:hypothetical protein